MIKRSMLIIALFSIIYSDLAHADVSVRGYYRKDGTYIQPHHRSDPDGNSYNNWSSIGNVNPYTGEPGNKTPGYNKYERGGTSYDWSQNTPLTQNPVPSKQIATASSTSDFYKVNVIKVASNFYKIDGIQLFFKTTLCTSDLITNEAILQIYTTGEFAYGEVLFGDGTICKIEGLYK